MNNRKPNAFVLGVILALTLGLNAQSRNQLNSAQEDKDFQKVFGAWVVQPGGVPRRDPDSQEWVCDETIFLKSVLESVWVSKV